MANQPEAGTYDVGVYQLATTDPVQGGLGGLSNTPLLNLANRTGYLYNHVNALEAGTFIPPTVAPLASPTFTGTVTLPAVAAGDNSQAAASTAFLNNLESGISPVALTNANVVLTAAQYGCGIIKLTGALTANVNVVFPVNGKWIIVNGCTGAYTVTCKTAGGTGVAPAQGTSVLVNGDATNIVQSMTYFNAIALTGACTATTQALTDNSTKIATTALVQGVAQLLAGNYGLDTGAANAYSIALTPALTARTTSQVFRVKFINACTGACTIADGVGGTVALVALDGTALRGGDIAANSWHNILYDGAQYRVLTILGQHVSNSISDTASGYVNIAQMLVAAKFRTEYQSSGYVTGQTLTFTTAVVAEPYTGILFLNSGVFAPTGEVGIWFITIVGGTFYATAIIGNGNYSVTVNGSNQLQITNTSGTNRTMRCFLLTLN